MRGLLSFEQWLMTLAFSSDQLQMEKHKALLTRQKVDKIEEGKIVATQKHTNTIALTMLYFAQCRPHILHAVA